jgi:hypothetical protein
MEAGADDAGFALEVTRFTPTFTTELLPISTLADFDAAVGRYESDPEMVFGLICDEGAGGAFYLFISGDRAWIHLTAGPCSTARDRATQKSAERLVFRLDNGERRTVARDETVSREQGCRALRHWFLTEQPWDELDWTGA